MIKVYHGTNLSSAFDISIHGIDLNKSLPNLDFGKVFYTTDNKKKAIDRAFDIVFGEIADGTIANVANRIKNSDLNINEVDYSLFIPKSGSYYENQYSFHTLKALTCIKSISCAIIKPYNKRKRRR